MGQRSSQKLGDTSNTSTIKMRRFTKQERLESKLSVELKNIDESTIHHFQFLMGRRSLQKLGD